MFVLALDKGHLVRLASALFEQLQYLLGGFVCLAGFGEKWFQSGPLFGVESANQHNLASAMSRFFVLSTV